MDIAEHLAERLPAEQTQVETLLKNYGYDVEVIRKTFHNCIETLCCMYMLEKQNFSFWKAYKYNAGTNDKDVEECSVFVQKELNYLLSECRSVILNTARFIDMDLSPEEEVEILKIHLERRGDVPPNEGGFGSNLPF